MPESYVIDFLEVGTSKSGDAICYRYSVEGITKTGIVDGGFQETGSKIIEHLDEYYGQYSKIDSVLVTHPDGDHAGGLRTVLEEREVSELWMLRPWKYADELIDRFARFTSVENLAARLREIYPNIAELERIALEKGIPIREPFQGKRVGAFIVLAPSKPRYLDLIVASEKTPEASRDEAASATFSSVLGEMVRAAAGLIRTAWGVENFPESGASSENEMSVIQYAKIAGKSILLTGDAGREGLTEAADYFEAIGGRLPGIDEFQIPHHGSRHNVSSEVLDRWLGSRITFPGAQTGIRFNALVSAAKEDEKHPRKVVIKAIEHRSGKLYTNKFKGTLSIRENYPPRLNWDNAIPFDYPDDQEE